MRRDCSDRWGRARTRRDEAVKDPYDRSAHGRGLGKVVSRPSSRTHDVIGGLAPGRLANATLPAPRRGSADRMSLCRFVASGQRSSQNHADDSYCRACGDPPSLTSEEEEQWPNCELCHQPDDEAHLPCHCGHDTVIKLRDKLKTALNKYIVELTVLYKRPTIVVKLAEAIREFAWKDFNGWRAFRGHWTPDARQTLIQHVPELTQRQSNKTLQLLRKTAKDVGTLLANLAKDTWAARCKHVADGKVLAQNELRYRQKLATMKNFRKRKNRTKQCINSDSTSQPPGPRETKPEQRKITQYFLRTSTKQQLMAQLQISLDQEYMPHNLVVTEVPGDGDCLLHAIKLTGPESIRSRTCTEIRNAMCDHLLQNKEEYFTLSLGLWSDKDRPAQYATYEQYVQHLREPMDLDIALSGRALTALYSFRLICHSAHYPVLEFNSECNGQPAIVIHTPGHFMGVTLVQTPSPTSLIGRTFLKKFKQDGRKKRRQMRFYLGTIQSYNIHTQLYRVTYEDEDYEDLATHEVLALDFTVPILAPDWTTLRPASLNNTGQTSPSQTADDGSPSRKGRNKRIICSPSTSPSYPHKNSRSRSPSTDGSTMSHILEQLIARRKHQRGRSRTRRGRRRKDSEYQSTSPTRNSGNRRRTRTPDNNNIDMGTTPIHIYTHKRTRTQPPHAVFAHATPETAATGDTPDTTSLVRGTLPG